MHVVLLTKNAQMPEYESEDAAGMDLRVDFTGTGAESFVLEPGKRHLFKTGISVAAPDGYYARIAPRSGLAYKKGIDVMAGVIDRDYRGEVGVILVNLGQEPVTITQGDRIAQMILERCGQAVIKHVDELFSTERGAGGFGSTGES